MQLHCPECKSTNISPINETSTEGGYAVHNRVTKNTGFSNIVMKSTHRNYWMCASCGEKFRNIKNLQQEIVATQKNLRSCLIAGVLVVIILLCSIILDAVSAFLPLVVILALIDGAYILIYKKRITDMVNELQYLKKKCFD